MSDAHAHDELAALGATREEIDAAEADGTLHLLALEYSLFPGSHPYTFDEAALRAGIDPAVARRFRRALGFPDADVDGKFGDDDVEIMRLHGRFAAGVAFDLPTPPDAADTDVGAVLEGGGLDVSLQLSRVVGSSMARIAEAQVGFIGSALYSYTGGAEPTHEQIELVARLLPALVSERLPEVERILHYTLRRHLIAAARREVLWQSVARAGLTEAAVGFCDIVGFTALSEHVDPVELAGIVERFETKTHELVSTKGGRVVKTIGDAVMFTTPESARAVEIALSLTEAFSEDETLRNVRAGVAAGQLLSRDGDLFGPVVNLSSRITARALPGTVLVSDSVHAELADDTDFRWLLLRPRRLKGIGVVRVWAVRRATDKALRPVLPRPRRGSGRGADREPEHERGGFGLVQPDAGPEPRGERSRDREA